MSETPSDHLQDRLERTALAFRGYNVTNLGRTAELLGHRAYSPVVRRVLDEASEFCSDALAERLNLAERIVGSLLSRWRRKSRPIDLVRRVRENRESSLETYPDDIALIVAIELAHLKLLEEFFGVEWPRAQMSFGYSLGEVSALVAGGVFNMEAALGPILHLAADVCELARDVSMGVLFSRGGMLDVDKVERLCLEITSRGEGTIAISTYLSPNTVLLLGQRDTVAAFREAMPAALADHMHLKLNPHRWPPMHTPIIWQRNIPNRAGVLLATAPGGFEAPSPPILSCVTGELSYTDANSRKLINEWIDHPQDVWGVVHGSLAAGVERVIHVGPEPNILPATYKRLSNNVAVQLSGGWFSTLGRRALSRIVRRHRPWLKRLLSTDAALLRAPFVEHIILEDWLLENAPT